MADPNKPPAKPGVPIAFAGMDLDKPLELGGPTMFVGAPKISAAPAPMKDPDQWPHGVPPTEEATAILTGKKAPEERHRPFVEAIRGSIEPAIAQRLAAGRADLEGETLRAALVTRLRLAVALADRPGPGTRIDQKGLSDLLAEIDGVLELLRIPPEGDPAIKRAYDDARGAIARDGASLAGALGDPDDMPPPPSPSSRRTMPPGPSPVAQKSAPAPEKKSESRQSKSIPAASGGSTPAAEKAPPAEKKEERPRPTRAGPPVKFQEPANRRWAMPLILVVLIVISALYYGSIWREEQRAKEDLARLKQAQQQQQLRQQQQQRP